LGDTLTYLQSKSAFGAHMSRVVQRPLFHRPLTGRGAEETYLRCIMDYRDDYMTLQGDNLELLEIINGNRIDKPRHRRDPCYP
jgi:hypothetical protein